MTRIDTRPPPSNLPDDLPSENHFRLYVSTASPISLRAIANARRILHEAFPGTHQLTVLNIAEHVEMARADQIIVSPTLLRITPLPQRRFIGDLSNLNRLRKALGVQPPQEAP